MVDKFYRKFGKAILIITVLCFVYMGNTYADEDNLAGVIWSMFVLTGCLTIKIKDFNERGEE